MKELLQELAEQRTLITAGRIGPDPPRYGEEAEHPLQDQRRGGLFVVGQAAVGEQVLVAGVQEQLRVRGSLDQLAGGTQVLLGEERVGVHPVDLDRGKVRPRAAELGHRDAGVEQQGTPGPRPGLGQRLRGQHAEREPRVDELVRQALDGGPAALDDRVEADLLGVPDAVLQRAEGLAVVQVGDGHPVPGRAELVCEPADPVGEALRVMEHDNVSHGCSLRLRSGRTSLPVADPSPYP